MSTVHWTTSASDAPAASSATLDVLDGADRLLGDVGRDDGAGVVDAVLAADVDGRRARGHDGDMAERRAHHETGRLQTGDLHDDHGPTDH